MSEREDVEGFIKLSPVPGQVSCCTCGCGSTEHLSQERRIEMGFGSAGATRNGKHVWSEQDKDDPECIYAFMRVSDIEAMAVKDPEQDWRIHFYGPMYESEYQRQGPELWVLVKKGDGFA